MAGGQHDGLAHRQFAMVLVLDAVAQRRFDLPQPKKWAQTRSMPPSMYPKLLAGLTTASAGWSKMSPCDACTCARPEKACCQAMTRSPLRSRK